MARSVVVEMARRVALSPRMVAIGASNTGARASPGTPARIALTQRTSGMSLHTCRIASTMPINSTPPIRAFSPGFAMNAKAIWRYRIIATKPIRIRKTRMRTRKMRGEESRYGSRSDAMGLVFRSAANQGAIVALF